MKRRGVTMLEVLVASLVLSIGLVGAINVVASTTKAAQHNADYQRAMMAARSKMDEVLKEPVLQPGADQGVGVDQTTDYDWYVSIEETSNPALMRVTVRVENRISKLSPTPISTLRRPDLNTAPDGTSTVPGEEETTTGTGSTTGGAGTGGTTL